MKFGSLRNSPRHINGNLTMLFGWLSFALSALLISFPLESAKGGPMVMNNDFNLNDLPDIGDQFRSWPYLKAVAHLQKMSKEEAYKKLLNLSEKDPGAKVIVLCRMLFVRRKGGEFHCPGLGEAICLGKSRPSDWPLLPIEITSGIPFLVVRGYSLEGLPESSKDYLKYCKDNCDWSLAHFAVLEECERSKALEKLLGSPKWESLSASDLQFLVQQIK